MLMPMMEMYVMYFTKLPEFRAVYVVDVDVGDV
jgi:hypothetical protein